MNKLPITIKQDKKFNVPYPNLTLFEKSIAYDGPKIHNSISESIKTHSK